MPCHGLGRGPLRIAFHERSGPVYLQADPGAPVFVEGMDRSVEGAQTVSWVCMFIASSSSG